MRDQSALPALLERIKAATGPSFALEQEIERVLEPDRTEMGLLTLRYSASLDAALALCERRLSREQVGFVITDAVAAWREVYVLHEMPVSALSRFVLAALVAAEMEEKDHPGRVIDALTPLPPDEEKLLDEYGPERTPEPKDA